MESGSVMPITSTFPTGDSQFTIAALRKLRLADSRASPGPITFFQWPNRVAQTLSPLEQSEVGLVDDDSDPFTVVSLERSARLGPCFCHLCLRSFAQPHTLSAHLFDVHLLPRTQLRYSIPCFHSGRALRIRVGAIASDSLRHDVSSNNMMTA